MKRRIRPTQAHSRAIKAAIKAAGCQMKLANQLGISQANISSWLNCKQVIPLHHAEKLEELYTPDLTVLRLRPDILKYAKYFG